MTRIIAALTILAPSVALAHAGHEPHIHMGDAVIGLGALAALVVGAAGLAILHRRRKARAKR